MAAAAFVFLKFVMALMLLSSSGMVEAIPPPTSDLMVLPASTQYLPRPEAVKSNGLWNILYGKWSLSKKSPSFFKTTLTSSSINSLGKIGFEPLFHLDQDDTTVVTNERRRSIDIPPRFKIYEAVPTNHHV